MIEYVFIINITALCTVWSTVITDFKVYVEIRYIRCIDTSRIYFNATKQGFYTINNYLNNGSIL